MQEKIKRKDKEKSTLGWVLEFAGMDKTSYLLSIFFSIISVSAGFVPYVFIAHIVKALVAGEKDMNYYLKQCGFIAVCWVINKVFHTISTTLSHRATFAVLAEIRRRLTKKLSVMPLGDVLADSSGSYKNIIVERVDSIETTLAHIVPEVIGNAVVPIGIFVIMLTIDWRLALLSLISVPASWIDYIFSLSMRCP